MATTTFWREFEHFVARLEEALSPAGAVIRSPDREILDQVTGGLREVDASIRYRAGSKDVLVTVECRVRSRAQDITWIEQLVTKRNDIGAARTIAVSTRPLSSGARKKAEHHGIELRQVDHVTDAEIAAWVQGITIEFEKVLWNVVSARFYLYYKDGRPFELAQIQLPGYDAPLIRHALAAEPFSPNDLIETLMRHERAGVDGQRGQSFGDSIELGQPRRRVTIKFGTAEAEYSMRVDDKWLSLRRFEMELEVWKERAPISFSVGANYSAAGHHLIRVAEGEVVLGGRKSLIVQWSPSKDKSIENERQDQPSQAGANLAE